MKTENVTEIYIHTYSCKNYIKIEKESVPLVSEFNAMFQEVGDNDNEIFFIRYPLNSSPLCQLVILN